MELKDFIQEVLVQMEELKTDPLKQKYMVEELEFELTLTETNNGKVGISFAGIGGSLNNGKQNEQKVKVKLIPSTKLRNQLRNQLRLNNNNQK